MKTRAAVIRCLCEHEEGCTSAFIACATGIAQADVQQELDALMRDGIVSFGVPPGRPTVLSFALPVYYLADDAVEFAA